jgi:hypothetical protein
MSFLQVPKLTPPLNDQVIEKTSGLFSTAWQKFIKLFTETLEPLGIERAFPLGNNISSAAIIEGLSFNSQNVSQAVVEYLIQRVTTGTGANELIETGVFHLAFKPVSNTWSKVVIGTPGPSTSGVTLTVNSSGQVQYTSSNITGTASISRIIWRARTIGAKHHTYSLVGR